MAMALLAQRFVRVKMIFDIRGLMAEEYADAGIWPHDSLRFRMVKKLERAGIRHADQILWQKAASASPPSGSPVGAELPDATEATIDRL